MHGAGFRPKQINLQMHFQTDAEAGFVGAHLPAAHPHTGNNQHAAAPAVSRRGVADLRFHHSIGMPCFAFAIAHPAADGNRYTDMPAGIRAMGFHRRPPWLRPALMHLHQPEGRAGALRKFQRQPGAKLRDAPAFATEYLLQKHTVTLGLYRPYRLRGADDTAVMRRRAGLDGPRPGCSLMKGIGNLAAGLGFLLTAAMIHGFHRRHGRTARMRAVRSRDLLMPAGFTATGAMMLAVPGIGHA